MAGTCKQPNLNEHQLIRDFLFVFKYKTFELLSVLLVALYYATYQGLRLNLNKLLKSPRMVLNKRLVFEVWSVCDPKKNNTFLAES